MAIGYYPINLNITHKSCLVIGGGKVAQRKVEGLVESQASVTVISPSTTRALDTLAAQGLIRTIRREYRQGDLEGAFLVISATDDEEINQAVFAEASEKGILVNVVDQPELCNFIVPSVVRRGDLVISISTSGKCPALAKRVRKQIEKQYGPEYQEYLLLLSQAREKIKARYEMEQERGKALERVMDSGILELIRVGKKDLAEETIERCI
ncbi:precorrin-2 dehydrogenase/sirohydrochlorin ferrochelatase family protein [Candidatus Hakubella thermalkaliphila]|uniref:precorrin-2 dehydrogenase/sirohydrochlorin ferrochelatase family protein n=1 Tax=Candidatus Hakubella thermalkaliphila TaxID=2754717 RepID=UPI0021592D94|nr:bifunctional precorrin-2 dehydrogenase/sirohydrochlorin ferrochelatase [Candidatus Hakubella thermalkaliphila]